jgi:hypothetical protein
MPHHDPIPFTDKDHRRTIIGFRNGMVISLLMWAIIIGSFYLIFG